LQLVAGVAIGMWLRRPKRGARDADLRRAHSLALNLHGLTHQIGDTVSLHRERFEAAEQKLQGEIGGKRNPTTDLVVGVVGEILKANREMQRELLEAESQIADQTAEIETHLTSSLTDPLTELPNRRALDEQLARRLEDYRKHGTPFSLLLFDLDHFKQINDTFGHPVGDEVLKSLSGAVRGVLRRHDFIARYGGEEFAIILPYTTINEAQRAAGKAGEGVAILSAEFAHLNRPVTASGGLASILPGEEVATLVERADRALYAAKENGRNRVFMHDGHECRALDPDVACRDWEAAATVDEKDEASAAAGTIRSDKLIDACGDLQAALLEVSEPAGSSSS
jgi:diguanylate cyclase